MIDLIRFRLSLLPLALLLACATSPRTRAPDSPATLTVVTLNDLHGALEPRVYKTADGATVPSGGAALIQAYVNRIRATAHGPVLVVDSGDLFQGTLVSNLGEGAPVIDFYNHLGVAAAAVGNHEFDYGPVGPDPVVLHPGEDPRGALKARIQQASFPFLAANIRGPDGKVPSWLKPSVLLDVGGVKVGIVGAATPSTPSTTVAANLTGLSFLDPVKPVVEEATHLRKEGAKVVVLIIHAGSGCPPSKDVTDLSACHPGELMDLLHQLPPGLIDVIAAGHTHQRVRKRVGNTAVIEAYAYGQWLGVVRVPLAGSQPPTERLVPVCGAVVNGPHGPTCDPRVVRKSHGKVMLAELRGAQIAPDPSVERLLAPALARVREKKQRPLGVTLTAALTPAYGSESSLGDLVADISREAAGAQVGVANGGGLRAALPAGPLTYGEVFEALPFDNKLAVVTVKGSVLRKMVELGVAGRHGALSWSGLTFQAQGCQVGAISVGGQPLDPDGSYTVATNDYLAGGGSGFAGLGIPKSDVKVLWEKPYLRDVVAGLLERSHSELLPAAYGVATHPRQKVEGTCNHRH